MIEHKFIEKINTLEITTDVRFKDCCLIADLLCDNGFEVIEVRRTDGGAFNIITVECAEKDIEKIVGFVKLAAE